MWWDESAVVCGIRECGGMRDERVWWDEGRESVGAKRKCLRGHGSSSHLLLRQRLVEQLLNAEDHFRVRLEHRRDLLHDLLAPSHALLRVARAPPVPQMAGRIEEAAEAVEAVAHLVADHRAEGPVLHGQVAADVEQRALEEPHGDDDLVRCRTVIRIYSVRHAQRLRLPIGVFHTQVEVRAATLFECRVK
jgi:hypothetical protein